MQNKIMMPKSKQIDAELHAKIFLGLYPSINLEHVMRNSRIEVLALESPYEGSFATICDNIERNYAETIRDEVGISFTGWLDSKERYLLRGREYISKEGFHLLSIGKQIDAPSNSEIRKLIDLSLKKDAFPIIAHPLVDTGKTKTAGHINQDLVNNLNDLCVEYSDKIALEWNAYCIPWVRKGLKYFLNAAGAKTYFHDVNQVTEELLFLNRISGYNIPLVAGTDVDVWKMRHLPYIGTARVKVNIEGKTPERILSSMKNNIFEGKYDNVKNYVSAFHLIDAYGVHVLSEIVKRK